MDLRGRLFRIPAILLLVISGSCAQAATAKGFAAAIEILPDQSYLAFDSAERAVIMRQASTPVQVVVTGAPAATPHRIEIYACVESEEAMTAAGRSSALAIASLRVRDAQGEWEELAPLAELAGRRGVRIAILNGNSARILLQVQLRVPPSQSPGAYQGTLTLLALEE